MKVFISCDIEGVGCVVRPEHSTIDGREYAQSRRLMTAEVNAAIRGAFDAGAVKVVVADSHNVGLNLLPEELDERAEIIMGSPRPLAMMEGVQKGFDAAFFVGYHARPGTADGVIAHNFHRRLHKLKLNDQVVGEMGFNAALAGIYGVPVALVTGDAATAAEAGNLMPWAETVVVKQGLGAYAAQCLHPRVCQRLIFEGARRALVKLPSMKAWNIEQPVVLELELTSASGADQVERIPGLTRISAQRVRSEPVSLKTALDMFLLSAEVVELVPFI